MEVGPLLHDALTLLETGQVDGARQGMDLALRATAQWPYDWRGWVALGKCANFLREYIVAEHAFNRVLALCELPMGRADGWLGLAIIQELYMNKTEAALGFAERARTELPDNAAPHLKCADLLRDLHRWNAADQYYTRALELQPGWLEVRHNRSFLRFRQARWRDAWRDYTCRWDSREFTNNVHGAPKSKPRWGGVALETRRLLVWMEQGFGDSLWGLRYVDVLLERHPQAQVILRVPQQLYRHIWINYRDRCTVLSNEDPLPEFDVHVPLLNLPVCLEQWEPFVGRPHHTEDGDAYPWDSARKNIGIVWAGGPQFLYNASRNTHLLDWEPVLALRDHNFVSLQIGTDAPEGQTLHDRGRLQDMRPLIKDFADTANVLAGLDLIIGVDTSVLHLGSLLGVPTWWLLGDRVDWRWFPETPTTPWYPTARLWRKQLTESWRDVFTHVAAELGQQ